MCLWRLAMSNFNLQRLVLSVERSSVECKLNVNSEYHIEFSLCVFHLVFIFFYLRAGTDRLVKSMGCLIHIYTSSYWAAWIQQTNDFSSYIFILLLYTRVFWSNFGGIPFLSSRTLSHRNSAELYTIIELVRVARESAERQLRPWSQVIEIFLKTLVEC